MSVAVCTHDWLKTAVDAGIDFISRRLQENRFLSESGFTGRFGKVKKEFRVPACIESGTVLESILHPGADFDHAAGGNFHKMGMGVVAAHAASVYSNEADDFPQGTFVQSNIIRGGDQMFRRRNGAVHKYG